MTAITGQPTESVIFQSATSRGFDPDTNNHVTAQRQHISGRAHLTLLARTVEAEILPRLLLAHQAPLPTPPPPMPPGADVVELAQMVLAPTSQQANHFIDSLRLRHLPAAAIYLDMLAPAARLLGALWEDDRCDFAQVTLGLMRLQHLLRVLSPEFLADAPRTARPARVLLLCAPGEQHSFGLAMVGEFFRRAGWAVCGGPATSSEELLAQVRHTRFAVLGLSIGSLARLDDAVRLVRALRRASCNRAIAVMVGGPLAASHPEIAAMLGADAIATDSQQAVAQAQALLALTG